MSDYRVRNANASLSIVGYIALVIALVFTLAAAYIPSLIGDATTAAKLIYIFYTDDAAARLNGVFLTDELAQAAFDADIGFLLVIIFQALGALAIWIASLWILKKELWDQGFSRKK